MVYSLAYNSVKLFHKPIGFVQTHRYYSKKSTRPTGPKYKKEYKDKMKLSPFLKQALIGLILGYVYASRPKAHYNTRLVFDQSKEKHSDYLNYLYSLFEPFVGTEPTSTNRKPDFTLFIKWENICMSHLWTPFYGYQYLRDNQIPNAKFYSSSIKENNNPGLDPWFITGITDAEGCFLISVLKDSEYKLGWQCRVKFKITLHSKDFPLLLDIQPFFGGVGSIQNNPNGTRDYIVTDLKEITTVIIPHILKYPLLTQKAADFLLF